MKASIYDIQSLMEVSLTNMGKDMLEDAYENAYNHCENVSRLELEFHEFKFIKNNKVEFIYKDKKNPKTWVKVVLKFEDIEMKRREE